MEYEFKNKKPKLVQNKIKKEDMSDNQIDIFINNEEETLEFIIKENNILIETNEETLKYLYQKLGDYMEYRRKKMKTVYYSRWTAWNIGKRMLLYVYE